MNSPPEDVWIRDVGFTVCRGAGQAPALYETITGRLEALNGVLFGLVDVEHGVEP
jgi:hypothetical protein